MHPNTTDAVQSGPTHADKPESQNLASPQNTCEGAENDNWLTYMYDKVLNPSANTAKAGESSQETLKRALPAVSTLVTNTDTETCGAVIEDEELNFMPSGAKRQKASTANCTGNDSNIQSPTLTTISRQVALTSMPMTSILKKSSQKRPVGSEISDICSVKPLGRTPMLSIHQVQSENNLADQQSVVVKNVGGVSIAICNKPSIKLTGDQHGSENESHSRTFSNLLQQCAEEVEGKGKVISENTTGTKDTEKLPDAISVNAKLDARIQGIDQGKVVLLRPIKGSLLDRSLNEVSTEKEAAKRLNETATILNESETATKINETVDDAKLIHAKQILAKKLRLKAAAKIEEKGKNHEKEVKEKGKKKVKKKSKIGKGRFVSIVVICNMFRTIFIFAESRKCLERRVNKE